MENVMSGTGLGIMSLQIFSWANRPEQSMHEQALTGCGCRLAIRTISPFHRQTYMLTYAMQAMHETKSQEITSSIKPVVLALPSAHPLMPSFFRWAHDLNIVLG